MACEVILGRVALRDLARIREFISKDDPVAALSFCRKLLATPKDCALFLSGADT